MLQNVKNVSAQKIFYKIFIEMFIMLVLVVTLKGNMATHVCSSMSNMTPFSKEF